MAHTGLNPPIFSELWFILLQRSLKSMGCSFKCLLKLDLISPSVELFSEGCFSKHCINSVNNWSHRAFILSFIPCHQRARAVIGCNTLLTFINNLEVLGFFFFFQARTLCKQTLEKLMVWVRLHGKASAGREGSVVWVSEQLSLVE